ncbi:hypothetical protein EC991_008800 [Linnemannia zychae]|nr:hypothetical protein EC991_008800 [Linnemannia zychae]
MTPKQAFAILNAIFSELKVPSPQQISSSSQSQFLPSPFGEFGPYKKQQQEEEVVVENFSATSIAQIICTIRDDTNDGRVLIQEFFDAVFHFLYGQLTQSAERDDIDLASQFGIVNEIIHAAHIACGKTSGLDPCPPEDMDSELRMVFSSIFTQLLEPLWGLMRDLRQRESGRSFEEDERGGCGLLQERTLQSLQAASPSDSDVVVTTTKRFVGALMIMGGVFCESPASEGAMWGTKAGDVLPDLDVLATFELHELWIDYKSLWESIPTLFANEPRFDHLYGTSWIQLVYIYVSLDQVFDPTGTQRRPFSLTKIISGLQRSVHGRDSSSMAYGVLMLHVEEILQWLWRHDGTSIQDLVSKELPEVQLVMVK